jgi:hypothetical protein
MIDWPILSIVTFLPLVGVALILLIRGDDAIAQRNIRNIALFTTVVTFIVSLFIWGGFDSSNPGFQMVEESEWLGGLGHLQDGCGWHLDAVRHPDHLPDAACILASTACHHAPEGIHDRVPGARNADDRRFLRARYRRLSTSSSKAA